MILNTERRSLWRPSNITHREKVFIIKEYGEEYGEGNIRIPVKIETLSSIIYFVTSAPINEWMSQ